MNSHTCTCASGFSGNNCETSAVTWGSGSNYVVFGNYDGGNLAINMDQPSPNLHIGVVAYEPTTISITGAYASNVVSVKFSGYNAASTTCQRSGSSCPAWQANYYQGSFTADPGVCYISSPGDAFGDRACGHASGMICMYKGPGAPSYHNGKTYHNYNGGCNSKSEAESYFANQWGIASSQITTTTCKYGTWTGSTYSTSSAWPQCA